MKPNEIYYIKSLDEDEISGSIQNILLGNLGDITLMRFENVLKYLVDTFKIERDTLETENAKMRNELIKHGLYTSEFLGLE